MCDLGHAKEDHDCRLNYENFSKELQKLRDTCKQLYKKGVIDHIKRCFSNAVSQNKGKSNDLSKQLKKIPVHLFGAHENCGNWCKPNKKHIILLTDKPLYDELFKLFDKYAANAPKFSVAASSQANESFNNIVVHKAHKNKCLSKSAACDYRVKANTLQIAAKSGDQNFNVYVKPTQKISSTATEITGLREVNGDLYLETKKTRFPCNYRCTKLISSIFDVIVN